MKTLSLGPLWAAGILLSLSLSGCYWLRKQSEYYGISTKARQVAFVLDISGSMEWLNEPSVAGHLVQAGVQQSARPADILGSTAAEAGQVVIHSIGVGDDQDEQFMRELATQHNGQYYRSQWRVALP